MHERHSRSGLEAVHVLDEGLEGEHDLPGPLVGGLHAEEHLGDVGLEEGDDVEGERREVRPVDQ